MDVCLCFACPACYCELLCENLEESRDFLKELISQGLDSYPRKVIIKEVYLEFFAFENRYSVQVHLRCFPYLGVKLTDRETMQPEMEGLVSHILLQCFWEVHSLEY